MPTASLSVQRRRPVASTGPATASTTTPTVGPTTAVQTVIYAYDNLNRLDSQTDAVGNDWSYGYDAASRLTSRTDAKSQVTSYSYNKRTELTTINYPTGTTDVDLTYDDVGNRTQMDDDTGITAYVYDALNRLTSVTFPGSRAVAYAYDEVGNRETITYLGGSDEVTYAYDAANNLTTVTDWDTNETAYSYDNTGRLTATTLENDVVGSYQYDSADRLTGIVWKDASGGVLESVKYVLDAVGNRQQRFSRHLSGRATDSYSSLILGDSPVGYWRLGETAGDAQDSTANDNDGTVTIGAGKRAALGLVASDTDRSTQFDGLDAQVVISDAAVLQNIFDGGGTVEAVINPLSDGGLNDGHIVRKNPWILFVDADDGTNYSLKFHYYHSTTSGVWVTGVQFPLGEPAHVAVVYDADSVSNDPTLYVNGVPYTVGDGLTESSIPAGIRNSDEGYALYISNRPCCGGNVAFDGRIDEVALYSATVSQATIAQHAFQARQRYDSLVSKDVPVAYWRLGETSGNAIDISGNGNDGTVTIGAGAYDADSLVEGESDGSMEFDGAATSINVPADAAVDDVFDGGGTVEFIVNLDSDGERSVGRIISKNHWDLLTFNEADGKVAFGFQHVFSTTGGRWDTDVDIPLNQTVHVAIVYNHDSAANDPIIYIDGQPRTVGDGLTESQTPIGLQLGDSVYDLVIGDNGANSTTDGRLDEIAFYGTALSAAAIQRHVGQGEQYDNLYRLVEVGYNDAAGHEVVGYTYDAVGNRVTLSDNDGAARYAYDAADRLTSVTPAGQTAVTYTWDDNGNLTARGSDSFSWDAEDRLTSATVNSATTTFGYNGDGLRDSRTFNSNTTTFTWDVNRSIPQVMDDEDAQYTYGLGRIAKLEAPSIEGSGTYLYLGDGLGSTVKLMDGSSVIHDTEYDAFGEVRTEITNPITNEFKFTGEQVDGSTGLQYLRARYYDPAIGRFISSDPLSGALFKPGMQHKYAYGLNNPIVATDPLGLQACIESCQNTIDCSVTGRADDPYKYACVNVKWNVNPDDTKTLYEVCYSGSNGGTRGSWNLTHLQIWEQGQQTSQHGIGAGGADTTRNRIGCTDLSVTVSSDAVIDACFTYNKPDESPNPMTGRPDSPASTRTEGFQVRLEDGSSFPGVGRC